MPAVHVKDFSSSVDDEDPQPHREHLRCKAAAPGLEPIGIELLSNWHEMNLLSNISTEHECVCSHVIVRKRSKLPTKPPVVQSGAKPPQERKDPQKGAFPEGTLNWNERVNDVVRNALPRTRGADKADGGASQRLVQLPEPVVGLYLAE